MQRESPRSSEKEKFAADYMDKEKAFWRNVLCLDETKIQLFVHNGQRYEAFNPRNTVPTVKHGGGSIKKAFGIAFPKS